MILTEWKSLFLPSGCRMVERGIFNSNAVNSNQNDRNRQRFDDSQFPHPGLGNDEDDNNANNPSRTGGPITGGISGGFSKPSSSGGFNLGGGTHGGSPTGSQPTSSQNSGGSGFGIGGSITKPDGTQGSFQFGITKPSHEHGSSHHLGSLSNHSLILGHGSGGEHVIQKPAGQIGGISWTGHNVTIQKPPHTHIDHSSSNHSHIIHNKPAGSVQGTHGEGISWSNHSVTIHKPTFGHVTNHSHGHEHGSSGQIVIQKPPFQIGGISSTGHNITIQKPIFGHGHLTNHSHEIHKPPGHTEIGGSISLGHTQIGGSISHGHNQGGSQQGNNQGPHQGNNQGPHQGNNQGSHQGNNQGSQQGGYFYGNGQYNPDYSGQYVNHPIPIALPYQHVYGPHGGQGIIKTHFTHSHSLNCK